MSHRLESPSFGVSKATVSLPPKLLPIFTPPRGAVRYRAAYGGRGSGKSFSFAKMAAIWAYQQPIRVLCTREYQVSIKESFHAELKAAITSEPWLEAGFDIGENYLRCYNGSTFLFRGLRRNIDSIKSLAKIDLTIIEEAENVPESSWIALEPTVLRQPQSEIWPIWNPQKRGSPVDKRFRQYPPNDALIAEMQYRDNPWFPENLERQRQRDLLIMHPADYAWIWEGAYLERSEAQVLAHKLHIEEIAMDDSWGLPLYGLDFGFSQDPTAFVRCWVKDNLLYIDIEAGGVGIEIDDTATVVLAADDDAQRYAIRADSARPESISYLKRHGLPRIVGAAKGKGSVIDGITHLKSYDRIIVHPRCAKVINEMRTYSYKVNRLTADITTELEDSNNHYIDAIRYALEPIIKAKGGGIYKPPTDKPQQRRSITRSARR